MAANFQHPFQCIHSIERLPIESQTLLIGSAGPRIYCHAADSGKRLAVWPRNVEPSDAETPKVASEESSSGNQAPPEKKRKVASGCGTDESKSTDEVSGTWSTIPMLVVSSNGEYVIALTGEDKTIRVLKLEEDGSLHQLSAR